MTQRTRRTTPRQEEEHGSVEDHESSNSTRPFVHEAYLARYECA